MRPSVLQELNGSVSLGTDTVGKLRGMPKDSGWCGWNAGLRAQMGRLVAVGGFCSVLWSPGGAESDPS